MSDRLKFRIWDNKEKRYVEEYLDREIMLSIDGTLNAIAYDFLGNRSIEDINKNNRFEVEFCTGLKDEKDKLIYEGDIFKAEVINSFDGDENLYKIIYGQVSWFDIEGCFAFARYQPSDLFEIEIIGNIHEEKTNGK